MQYFDYTATVFFILMKNIKKLVLQNQKSNQDYRKLAVFTLQAIYLVNLFYYFYMFSLSCYIFYISSGLMMTAFVNHFDKNG